MGTHYPCVGGGNVKLSFGGISFSFLFLCSLCCRLLPLFPFLFIFLWVWTYPSYSLYNQRGSLQFDREIKVLTFPTSMSGTITKKNPHLESSFSINSISPSFCSQKSFSYLTFLHNQTYQCIQMQYHHHNPLLICISV